MRSTMFHIVLQCDNSTVRDVVLILVLINLFEFTISKFQWFK